MASRQKRRLDICVARTLLLFAQPIMLAAEKAISPAFADEPDWEPYFKQRRGSVVVKKLNIMRPAREAESDKGLDERIRHNRMPDGWIFPIIKVLRIDEIPQLEQVVRGELSIVGPRPIPDENREAYRNVLSADEYRKWLEIHDRPDLKKGLTGPNQLVVSRLDRMTPDDLRMEYERSMEYVTTANLRTDIAILGKTPFVLASATGEHILNRAGKSTA